VQSKTAGIVHLPVAIVPEITKAVETLREDQRARSLSGTRLLIDERNGLLWDEHRFRKAFQDVRVCAMEEARVEGRSTDWIATFLEPLTFMRLRHTVVTMLYRAGATVPEIGGITGHTISSDVVDTFTEPGASALDEDRPAFQDMIDKATAPERPYDFIVVHSLSRFSRDTMHSEFYVRKLRRAGVQLVSMTQELGENGQGDLIRKIFNAFDEHQSRENAKHPGHAGERPAGILEWRGSALRLRNGDQGASRQQGQEGPGRQRR
jgi:hypothetical protein